MIFVLMSLSRYYHTIKYLKTEQIFFQIFYKLSARIRRLFGLREKYVSYKQGNNIEFLPFPEKRESYKGAATFEFLNLSHRFCGTWDDRSLGDLWRYNLNYMDFILQPGLDMHDAMSWIEDFMDAVPRNAIASDPYPISLRGINWIKFLSKHRLDIPTEQLIKIDTFLLPMGRNSRDIVRKVAEGKAAEPACVGRKHSRRDNYGFYTASRKYGQCNGKRVLTKAGNILYC